MTASNDNDSANSRRCLGKRSACEIYPHMKGLILRLIEAYSHFIFYMGHLRLAADE